jgi:hypothetical protein
MWGLPATGITVDLPTTGITVGFTSHWNKGVVYHPTFIPVVGKSQRYASGW